MAERVQISEQTFGANGPHVFGPFDVRGITNIMLVGFDINATRFNITAIAERTVQPVDTPADDIVWAPAGTFNFVASDSPIVDLSNQIASMIKVEITASGAPSKFTAYFDRRRL